MAVDDAHDTQSPAEEDAATEAAVLSQLLSLHPIHVTFDELLREIAGEPEDFARRDAIERAVRDLTAAGLLHRNDDFVLPSRAALRFDELLGG
ncbi:MAG TPA: hypothetical protein VIE64_08030 [Solirubrobacterales bacterium]